MKKRNAIIFLIVIFLLLLLLGLVIAYAIRNHLSGQKDQGIMKAVFIDVGQGDSTLFMFPGGDTILIDGGDTGASAAILRELDAWNISSIDAIIATHGDKDHIGGLERIIREVQTDEFIWNCDLCETGVCERLEQVIIAKSIPKSCVSEGDMLHFDDNVDVRVLNPSFPESDSDNDNSIVLQVSHGKVDMLLTGDCEKGCEARLNARKSEILKVGHHGSRSSSSSGFLRIVRPRDAIISVGDNPYGHPADVVLYALAGSTIWRTDLNGTILAESDGIRYAISSYQR